MAHPVSAEGMDITDSRVMICVSYGDPDQPSHGGLWRILVWNWKTGDLVRFRGLNGYPSLTLPQVLNLSSADGSELVILDAKFIFLDEFRMAVVPYELTTAGVVVLDTLIPQSHSGYLRHLEFPPDLHGQPISVRVDHDRDLGTPNSRVAFIADPAQAVLVVELPRRTRGHHVLFIVRTQVLIEQIHLVHTGFRIPWDEWRRDVVAIEVRMPSIMLSTFIHGAQVMVMRKFWNRVGKHCHEVRTFDFGRRSTLQLQDGADGTERKVLFEDGVSLEFEPDHDMNPWGGLQPLGDGSLFYLVGCLSRLC